MRHFEGKVAVVTGGASGIGLASGALFAEQGMKVVLADIEGTALEGSVAALASRALEVVGVQTDVTDFESVQRLEQEVRRRYGAVHILMLNAGVSVTARPHIWDFELSDWRWAMAVNVWGVINGVKAFVGGNVDDGEEGHVVVTSSSVGLAPVPAAAVYSMTKSAVTSIAESLYGQLHRMGSAISVSVLIPPGTINTNLFTSARNRAAEYNDGIPAEKPPPFDYHAFLQRMNAAGNPRRAVEPREVAEYVLEGIRDRTFWLLPGPRHPDVQTTFDAIIRGRAESMLGHIPPEDYLQAST